jgi:membrane fusion protein, multidrug efflux system
MAVRPGIEDLEMKITPWVAFASIAIVLVTASCGAASSPTAIPTVVLSVNPGTSAGSISASAVIVPTHKAELSFPLTGNVRTVTVKPGDSVKAGEILASLDDAVLQARTQVADADLQAAQIQYKYLYRSGTDQEHMDVAQSDVDRAQALLDVAKATLAQATLTAPFDGTIASVDITPSEAVVAGQVIISLGSLSEFRVETTDLSERDAPRVQMGQKVEIDVPALGGSYAGKVIDISRISSTVGGDVVYKVTIEFEAQPQGLLWGMSASVRITVGQ